MILIELNKRCEQSHLTNDSELFFEFKDYVIVIFFLRSENYELDSDYYNLNQNEEKFNEVLKSISEISSISLRDYEYLGDRNDIGTYSEPISISLKMFSILRVIDRVDKSLIKSYKITTDFPDPMCASEPNFQFEIELEENDNVNT